MDSIRKINNTIRDTTINTSPITAEAPKEVFAMPNETVSPVKIIPKSIKIILFILLVISIASISAAIYFYRQSKLVVTKSETVQVESVKDIVAKVGKLITLPEGEEPTLATVADPTQLQNQPFFAKAKRGDQVLVYTTARKVILYDPVANKVIDIAPLNMGNPTNTPAPTPAPATIPKPVAPKVLKK